MSETTEWEDETYTTVLADEIRFLERRRQNDPSCTLSALEGILKNLYIHEGNNWDGRGAVQSLTMSATIAAYEQFIQSWKKEIAQ